MRVDGAIRQDSLIDPGSSYERICLLIVVALLLRRSTVGHTPVHSEVTRRRRVIVHVNYRN